MKTIHIYFGLALLLIMSQAHAQPPFTRPTYAEITGKSWLTNYYGKSLSSLGEITSIKIVKYEGSQLFANRIVVTNQMHIAIAIIEQSKIQDYDSVVGVPLGIPPMFSIEFADGMRVSCDSCVGSITLPDGREGRFLLIMPSPNKSPEPTAVGAGSSATRSTL